MILRDLGRSARGVKGIAFSDNDKVVSVLVTPKTKKGLKIITKSANDGLKATNTDRIKLQKILQTGQIKRFEMCLFLKSLYMHDNSCCHRVPFS